MSVSSHVTHPIFGIVLALQAVELIMAYFVILVCVLVLQYSLAFVLPPALSTKLSKWHKNLDTARHLSTSDFKNGMTFEMGG